LNNFAVFIVHLPLVYTTDTYYNRGTQSSDSRCGVAGPEFGQIGRETLLPAERRHKLAEARESDDAGFEISVS
jgi:hypothetical protein